MKRVVKDRTFEQFMVEVNRHADAMDRKVERMLDKAARPKTKSPKRKPRRRAQ